MSNTDPAARLSLATKLIDRAYTMLASPPRDIQEAEVETLEWAEDAEAFLNGSDRP